MNMHKLPPSTTTIAIFVALAVIFSSTWGVSAQAPVPAPVSGMEPEPPSTIPVAPSPETDCVTPLFNMSDCLGYVEESSNASVPDKNCCPELAGLLDSNPICLCQLLGNPNLTESYGIKIDVNRALKLPSVCGVSTPPISLCSAAGYPVPGPIASEVSPPPLSSTVSPPPDVVAPEGLGSSPSSGNNDNGASYIAGQAHAFFVTIAFSLLLTLF